MSYIVLIGSFLWVIMLTSIGVIAAERREWRAFWMVVGLLVATCLVVIAAKVMAS